MNCFVINFSVNQRWVNHFASVNKQRNALDISTDGGLWSLTDWLMKKGSSVDQRGLNKLVNDMPEGGK